MKCITHCTMKMVIYGTEELPCPAGHWCRDGHRYEIRPGYYGREMYEVNPLGNGQYIKDFTARRPLQHHDNTHAPRGCVLSNRKRFTNPSETRLLHFNRLKYISEVDVINQMVPKIHAPSPKHGNTSIKYEQKLCEVGHWCKGGYREACPKGRYGSSTGLTSELCSGPCAPAIFVPVVTRGIN